MDAGDKIALGAGLVAFLAASVAIWQAREARGSRRAAEQQVAEARNAVKAAEAQVEIALRAAAAAERSAHADETSARLALQKAHEEKAPAFEIRSVGSGQPPRLRVKIRMEKGQPLSQAIVRAVGSGVQLINGFSLEQNGSPQRALDLGAMHEGDVRTVIVYCEPVAELTTAPVEVECLATEEGLEPWFVSNGIRLRAPVEVVAGPSPHLRTPEPPRRRRGLFHDREPFLE